MLIEWDVLGNADLTGLELNNSGELTITSFYLGSVWIRRSWYPLSICEEGILFPFRWERFCKIFHWGTLFILKRWGNFLPVVRPIKMGKLPPFIQKKLDKEKRRHPP